MLDELVFVGDGPIIEVIVRELNRQQDRRARVYDKVLWENVQ